MNLSLRFGLWAGFLSMLYISLIFVTDKILLIKGWENITWLIIFVVMIFGSIKMRDQSKKKFVSFRPLLQFNFRVFLLAYLLKYVLIIGLFSADTELKNMAKEHELTMVRQELEKEFADQIKSQREENINRQIKAYESGGFGPRVLDLGLLIHLVGGFVLSAMVAGVIRRDEPEY